MSGEALALVLPTGATACTAGTVATTAVGAGAEAGVLVRAASGVDAGCATGAVPDAVAAGVGAGDVDVDVDVVADAATLGSADWLADAGARGADAAVAGGAAGSAGATAADALAALVRARPGVTTGPAPVFSVLAVTAT